MKMPKKRNKIKWLYITCSHIWHVDISKYVYWLNIHSVKVWWRYVLPNANVAHICDIIFADLPKKMVSKIKDTSRRKSTTMIYLTFDEYFRPLHKLVRLERGHRWWRRRWQTTDRILELPTDRHFLYLFEPVFSEIEKNVYID